MSVRCGHCHERHDSPAQALLCSRRQYAALAAEPAWSQPTVRTLTRKQLATIPVDRYGRGRYALRNEDGTVTLYWVDRTPEGATFVKVAHSQSNLRGSERERVFRAILDGALAASKLYASETGECGVCGAELTNPESVAAKIGPICAQKF
jgi:hypothetical protein